jgi:hypothetical protein
MASHRVAIGLLAVLAALPCRAAVRWYDTYEEGLELAKKTGRPIVVVFQDQNDKVRAAKKLFERDTLVPFHRLFVFIYIEVEVKDGKMMHAMFQKYQPGAGGHALPLIFLAGSDEKVISKLEGLNLKAGDMASDMAAAIKKIGGVASPRKARDAQEAFEQANALAAKKQLGGAAKLYKEVVDLGLKIPATEASKKELAKIEDMAKKDLAAARTDLGDKAYPEAVKKLASIEETFSPLPAAKEAREELAKLRALPEAKDALEKMEKRDAVAVRPARKSTDDPSDIEGEFFTEEELEALDKMGEGDAAQPAAKESGPAAECRRLLSFARGWIANNQPAKAREALKQIISKYPDSFYAGQARALLEKLE